MLTLGVWIVSAEVMDKVILSPVLPSVETELLKAIVTLESVGVVISIVKELTARLYVVLLFLSSVTENFRWL